jgi:hypothetical protein
MPCSLSQLLLLPLVAGYPLHPCLLQGTVHKDGTIRKTNGACDELLMTSWVGAAKTQRNNKGHTPVPVTAAILLLRGNAGNGDRPCFRDARCTHGLGTGVPVRCIDHTTSQRGPACTTWESGGSLCNSLPLLEWYLPHRLFG